MNFWDQLMMLIVMVKKENIMFISYEEIKDIKDIR